MDDRLLYIFQESMLELSRWTQWEQCEPVARILSPTLYTHASNSVWKIMNKKKIILILDFTQEICAGRRKWKQQRQCTKYHSRPILTSRSESWIYSCPWRTRWCRWCFRWFQSFQSKPENAKNLTAVMFWSKISFVSTRIIPSMRRPFSCFPVIVDTETNKHEIKIRRIWKYNPFFNISNQLQTKHHEHR